MEKPTTRLARFVSLPQEERRRLFAAAALLAVARLGVKVAGVSRTRHFLARVSPRWTVDPERLADLVRMACQALPGATPCLPRAIVLEALLRAAQHPAELRIGVASRNGGERLPAHAWVEVDGIAVAEDPSRYTALPVFGTR